MYAAGANANRPVRIDAQSWQLRSFRVPPEPIRRGVLGVYMVCPKQTNVQFLVNLLSGG